MANLVSGKYSHQFNAIVTLLSVSSMDVVAEVVAPNPFVSFQIESQNIGNKEKELMTENSRMDKNKRKAEEQIPNCPKS